MAGRGGIIAPGRAAPAILCWIAGAALWSAAALASAADMPAGFIPPVGGSQLMLFFSHPLAYSVRAPDTWGLRFERAHPVASASSGPYCAPLRHRTLIELQLARGSTPRLMFGRNVGWDFASGRLGPVSQRSWLRTPVDGARMPQGFLLP